ncbi:hypothetical protein H2248_002329 [Termitomyces sp. 'cryptogamus']|nr:hypothetical protein H2248_002329 [Termitomyces sp. 'cryptogamus']
MADGAGRVRRTKAERRKKTRWDLPLCREHLPILTSDLFMHQNPPIWLPSCPRSCPSFRLYTPFPFLDSILVIILLFSILISHTSSTSLLVEIHMYMHTHFQNPSPSFSPFASLLHV